MLFREERKRERESKLKVTEIMPVVDPMTAWPSKSSSFTATYCNRLQTCCTTSTHCNTLQHNHTLQHSHTLQDTLQQPRTNSMPMVGPMTAASNVWQCVDCSLMLLASGAVIV